MNTKFFVLYCARSIIITMLTSFLMNGCARSPASHFYVFNPLPLQKKQTDVKHPIRIGISEINIPSYLNKQQIIIHDTPHHVKLDEFQLWAGPLDKNIQRVVETNLSTLIPGASVVTFPWGIEFKPTYQLRLDISQFEVDTKGNTLLRATYVISSNAQLKQKRTLEFRRQSPSLTIDSFVTTLNEDLNLLTKDIATHLRER